MCSCGRSRNLHECQYWTKGKLKNKAWAGSQRRVEETDLMEFMKVQWTTEEHRVCVCVWKTEGNTHTRHTRHTHLWLFCFSLVSTFIFPPSSPAQVWTKQHVIFLWLLFCNKNIINIQNKWGMSDVINSDEQRRTDGWLQSLCVNTEDAEGEFNGWGGSFPFSSNNMSEFRFNMSVGGYHANQANRVAVIITSAATSTQTQTRSLSGER